MKEEEKRGTEGVTVKALPSINLKNYRELSEAEISDIRKAAAESIKFTGLDLKYDWPSLQVLSDYVERCRNAWPAKKEEMATKVSPYLTIWSMEVLSGKAVKSVKLPDGLEYVLLGECLFVGTKRAIEMSFEHPELQISTQFMHFADQMETCHKMKLAATGMELVKKTTGGEVKLDETIFESIKKTMDLLMQSSELPLNTKDILGALLGEMLIDHRATMWNKGGKIIGQNFMVDPSEMVERYLNGVKDIFWKNYEPLEQFIDEQANIGRQFLSDALEKPVGFDDEGVRMLSFVLTIMHEKKSKVEPMLGKLAMFYGKCLALKYDGVWTNKLGVFINPQFHWNPESIVVRHFLNGPVDDVFEKFCSVPLTKSSIDVTVPNEATTPIE